ncbi:hypothetical protein COCCADRAFT_113482 [Bipolaris zeicola 26-R-13]|uniref:Major facilitator superfamily (MFS) profile domain-containing protein n=1 Tax=Cochliobolus carbonum (strain 26-R-13) TaxID=930089 RepID=W6XVE4_COCC2|nr:uncharacterized protein COCCADRAFT_113482 [Bipolaris zeicola 26-R-13]EUC26749.1 hypothetical protein COCCADRAFT_113482 [Bipolaris zeicola 26-R-13]
MAAFIQSKAIRARAKEQLQILGYYSALFPYEESQLSVYITSFERVPPDPHEQEASNGSCSIVDRNYPYTNMAGVSIQTTTTGESFYRVDWESTSDSFNPRNWSLKKRIRTLLLLDLIAAVMTVASAIESPVAPQAAQFFHASETLQAFSGTGTYLVGFGLGALLAAPASEILGRYSVYLYSLCVCECWLLGSALAQNSGSLIVFRFLAGLFASAPLTVAGGSMSDLWNTKEMTWAFPMFAVVGFGGPALAPVIASYIGQSRYTSWRWAEWLVVILNGFCILMVVLGMEETFAPQLLQTKAKQLRVLTGDDRFKTAKEIDEAGPRSLLKKDFTRPFRLALEPIVLFLTLYNTIIYVVMFTFLVGYPYIFGQTYGIDQGLKNLCFLGLLVGILLSTALFPFILAKMDQLCLEKGDDGSGQSIPQESRLMFAMFGAPLLPIGLIWMGWTDTPTISIWSPLAASVTIGLGTVCIFISSYMYIIDSYQIYAASALTFVTIVRYVIAGVMTVVGILMYKNLGTHWTLTALGCISAVVTPVPYVLYYYGETIREKSKLAVR